MQVREFALGPHLGFSCERAGPVEMGQGGAASIAQDAVIGDGSLWHLCQASLEAGRPDLHDHQAAFIVCLLLLRVRHAL